MLLLQLPHPAVQRRQPAGVLAAVSRHQRVRQSPAAPPDQRRHQPLELVAPPTGACVCCVCVTPVNNMLLIDCLFVQKPGVPLSRGALITHCYSDLSFMDFICSMVTRAIQVTPSRLPPSRLPPPRPPPPRLPPPHHGSHRHAWWGWTCIRPDSVLSIVSE